MVPVPPHRVLRQGVSVGILLVETGAEVSLRDRIDHKLQRQPRATPVAGHQAHNCGQVASGAVASHRNPGRVAVDARGVAGHPPGRGVAVFRGAGKLRFRRQTVIHGHHHAAPSDCQVSTGPIRRVQVSHHPATAVKPDQHRKGPRTLRCVYPDRKDPVWPGNRAVLHFGHLGTGGTGPGLAVYTGLCRRNGMGGREAQGGH